MNPRTNGLLEITVKVGIFNDHNKTAEGISCFYFEAFDEQWKDPNHPDGSENHFGLFTVEGKAKYPLWEQVDNGVFNNLTRGGNPIEKTYKGNFEALLKDSNIPPITIKEEKS